MNSVSIVAVLVLLQVSYIVVDSTTTTGGMMSAKEAARSASIGCLTDPSLIISAIKTGLIKNSAVIPNADKCLAIVIFFEDSLMLLDDPVQIGKVLSIIYQLC